MTETEEYKNGMFYIQNLSSMIPALVMDPKPNEEVLDLAAAPGSKTTQIAAMMDNTGEIVANDMSRERIYKLKSILEQQGIINTTVVNFPGQIIWQQYPEYFDNVLVDAPCSMEGRFIVHEPKTYKDWSQKKVKVLGSRQHYLLRSAISATKVGGAIIYSTCTISPEENEEVIDWILKKESGSVKIEPIELPGVEFEHALTYWNKQLNAGISGTARILPSEKFEGFYIAKLRKIKSTVPTHNL